MRASTGGKGRRSERSGAGATGYSFDEKQFPALPTKAWGKERVLGAHKNTLFLGEQKTLMEEVQGRTEH